MATTQPAGFKTSLTAHLKARGLRVVPPGRPASRDFVVVASAGRTEPIRGLRRRCIVFCCAGPLEQTDPNQGLEALVDKVIDSLDDHPEAIIGSTSPIPDYQPAIGASGGRGGEPRRFSAVAVEVEQI